MQPASLVVPFLKIPQQSRDTALSRYSGLPNGSATMRERLVVRPVFRNKTMITSPARNGQQLDQR
jgi:hypothetical protein